MIGNTHEHEGRVSLARLLPWAGLAVVALGILVGYVGFIPGVWGQTALLTLFLVSVLALRRDVFSAVVLVGLSIVEDWFQLVPLPHDVFYSAIVGAMALLLVLFVSQRRERPWRDVRPLDLAFWGLFVLLGLLAVPRSFDIPGNTKTIFFVALNYWIYMFLAAFVFWLLGTMLARRGVDVVRLCQMLAAFAAVLAVHAIIQEFTGVVILATPYWVHYLALPGINGYRLAGGTIRATTFFMAPDMTESFFSSVVFLPLGLLFASRGWRARALYAGEVVLILLALLFTYGPVGWAAVAVGIVLFALFGLRGRARLVYLGGLAAVVVVGGLALTREWHALLKHATGPRELGLRLGIWRTALNIIRAHPLLGVGLGDGPTYVLRSAPYKDPSLAHPYPNPQNSFLAFAAVAGIPVLLVFLLILGRALWAAIRNYQRADARLRPVMLGALLLVAGYVINGFSDITFTSAALVPLVFLVLGVLASPRLARALQAGGETANGEQTGVPAAVPVRFGPPATRGQAPEPPEAPAGQ